MPSDRSCLLHRGFPLSLFPLGSMVLSGQPHIWFLSPASCCTSPRQNVQQILSLRIRHKVLSESSRPCLISTPFLDLIWFPSSPRSLRLVSCFLKDARCFPAFKSSAVPVPPRSCSSLASSSSSARSYGKHCLLPP